MHALLLRRSAWFALAAALGAAPALAQEVGVGARVFGPPPTRVIVTGAFTAGPTFVGAGCQPFCGGPWYAGRTWYGGGSWWGGSWWGGSWYRPPGFGFGPWGPWRSGPWGPWSPWFRPAPAVLPPIVIGGEQLFGPAAAARMLGVMPAPDPFLPLRPEVLAARAEVARADLARAEREEKAFASNTAARQRATKFMELGDGYFAQGNYVLAYDRYKSAVEAAPDLVEPFLRRGQALIAMQSYAFAATTYIHAFKMHPAWAKTNFRLDVVYGNRQREKHEHLDNLAAAAERQPAAELMFLLGAQLLYDGQAERALRFFEKAKELHQGEPLPIPGNDEKALAGGNNPGGNNAPAGQVRVPLAPAPAPAGAPRPAAKVRDRQPALF